MVLLEVCTGARFGVLAVVVEVFATAVGAGPVTVSTPFPGGREVVFDRVLGVDQGDVADHAFEFIELAAEIGDVGQCVGR